MVSNTSRGHIGRDTDNGSIDHETEANRFPSLNNQHCRTILHLAAGGGWTTDLIIQDRLDLTDEQKRECLASLMRDGLIELVGTVGQQFIWLTPRGNWVADTQSDDTTETVNEVEP